MCGRCFRVQHPWLKAQGAAADKPLDSVVLTRIKKLSAMNKLKKAALVVMAKSLSQDEINGLQQLFRSIDADGNGTITVDELRTALSSLNGRLQVPRFLSLLSPNCQAPCCGVVVFRSVCFRGGSHHFTCRWRDVRALPSPSCMAAT